MGIERVGVVGCGLMGSGIAEVCARAGLDVIVREVDDDALDRGRSRIDSSLARALRSGKLSQEERDRAFEAIRFTTDLTVHAWDLARGIGADDRLDPELVEACYQAALPMEPMLRQSGMFGDKVEVGDDADTQARLLGMMGRTP